MAKFLLFMFAIGLSGTKCLQGLKLDFKFLHSIEYFDGLLNDKAQKYFSFGLVKDPWMQENRLKQLTKVWSDVGNPVFSSL